MKRLKFYKKLNQMLENFDDLFHENQIENLQNNENIEIDDTTNKQEFNNINNISRDNSSVSNTDGLVLLFDNVTNGVMEQNQEEIIKWLNQLRREIIPMNLTIKEWATMQGRIIVNEMYFDGLSRWMHKDGHQHLALKSLKLIANAAKIESSILDKACETYGVAIDWD